jgi:hypothetical protein
MKEYKPIRKKDKHHGKQINRKKFCPCRKVKPSKDKPEKTRR